MGHLSLLADASNHRCPIKVGPRRDAFSHTVVEIGVTEFKSSPSAVFFNAVSRRLWWGMHIVRALVSPDPSVKENLINVGSEP